MSVGQSDNGAVHRAGRVKSTIRKDAQASLRCNRWLSAIIRCEADREPAELREQKTTAGRQPEYSLPRKNRASIKESSGLTSAKPINAT